MIGACVGLVGGLLATTHRRQSQGMLRPLTTARSLRSNRPTAECVRYREGLRLSDPVALRPMRLLRIPAPFDHPDWLYEGLKFDGFRALAHVTGHYCQPVCAAGTSRRVGRISLKRSRCGSRTQRRAGR